MAYFPDQISKYLNQPRNGGDADSFNAAATDATLVCGSAVRFTLRIEDQVIAEVRFKTNGCGYLVAAADLLTGFVAGKKLSELHALEGIEGEIEAKLGSFPVERRHCLALSISTMRQAFADYRATQISEFAGDAALICTCFGVSETTIEKVVSENFSTVEEVSARCNAGAGCGSCQPLIQEIIDGYDIIRN